MNERDEGFLQDLVHLTVEGQATLAWLFVDSLLSIGSQAPCPDVNDDMVVDIDDIVAVVLDWGTSDFRADVNGDETVDIDDIIDIVLAWGACTPSGP